MSDDNENEDPILTLKEASERLSEEIEEQEQAICVLGAAKEDQCTYSQGYLPRQALYACITCMENDRHPLLCYACSIHCHEGHSVNELFTKRDKRCDCPTHSCKIQPLVIEPNIKNKYNHNSQKGTYCICKRTFPDDTDPIADSMYQCVICEDWLHTRHLFTTEDVTIIPETASPESHITHKVMFIKPEIEKLLDSPTTEIVCVGCRKKHPCLQDKSHICQTDDAPKPESITKCLVFDNSRRVEWRQCEDCEDLLDKHKILFMADITDSIYHFENVQKKQVDTEIKSYLDQNFDHAAQMTIASGMQELRTGLTEFLKSRKRAGDDVITEDNVREFFDGFKKKKKASI